MSFHLNIMSLASVRDGGGGRQPAERIRLVFFKRQIALAFLLAVLADSLMRPPIDCLADQRLVVDDPTQDGWTTEVLHGAAANQLGRLARLVGDTSRIAPDVLHQIVASDFTCGRLVSVNAGDAYREPSLTVRRGTLDGTSRQRRAGVDHLANELRQLGFSGDSQARVKFKIFRIQVDQHQFTTRQLLTMSGRRDGRRREVHATWQCRWSRKDDSKLPRLQSIELQDFEETVAQGNETLFSDCTDSVFGRNASYRDQLRFGIDYWSDRLLRVGSEGMQGLAVADVNGDGLDDVYICQIGPLPNRLFIQNSDGTVIDRSAEAGVDWHEPSHSALFVDVDNDGDQDLFVSTRATLLLMENDGGGRFSRRSTFTSARNAYSLAAADYDRDGDLDVFACVYLARSRRREVLAMPVPFHDARNGGRNVLLRNEGGWKMRDVTDSVGLGAEATRRSFAASWEDFDNDGDLDLYVANDYGPNNLFRNQAGRFTDVADEAGVVDQSFGMSVSWGDYDRDGWMDLYVSNMFSAAGNRITFQPRFRAGEAKELRGKFQYMSRGNSLFRNLGTGNFGDVSRAAGIMVGYWSWGSKFADLNNDGYEDVVVLNGFLTQQDSSDL